MSLNFSLSEVFVLCQCLFSISFFSFLLFLELGKFRQNCISVMQTFNAVFLSIAQTSALYYNSGLNFKELLRVCVKELYQAS